MRRWIFVAMIALCAIACEKKVEGKEEDNVSGNVYHVTCFSAGQVVYEGDWKYSTGDGWDYIDVKTKLKFRLRDHNDCYWTNAPFYKVNR
ncbi:MAG: hypothetical protein NTX72_00700 [Candidatus Uhrbacteria bacterium]|nr:hypothetical protein [Candidatus Uhrbacteria bacterium]